MNCGRGERIQLNPKPSEANGAWLTGAARSSAREQWGDGGHVGRGPPERGSGVARGARSGKEFFGSHGDNSRTCAMLVADARQTVTWELTRSTSPPRQNPGRSVIRGFGWDDVPPSAARGVQAPPQGKRPVGPTGKTVLANAVRRGAARAPLQACRAQLGPTLMRQCFSGRLPGLCAGKLKPAVGLGRGPVERGSVARGAFGL